MQTTSSLANTAAMLPNEHITALPHASAPIISAASALLTIRNAAADADSANVRTGELTDYNCATCSLRLREFKGNPHRIKGTASYECQKCYNQRYRKNKNTSPSTSFTPVRSSSAPASILSLTSEQQTHLTNVIKQEGFGKQGRSRSEGANARLILQVNNVARKLSYDAAVKTVVLAERAAPATVRKVVDRYKRKGSLTTTPSKKMKITDPEHMLYLESGPSVAVQEVLYKKVEESRKLNLYCSLTTLAAEVFAATGEDICKSTLHLWMTRDLKLEWGERKLTGLEKKTADAMIRRYMLSYAAAKAEEDAGTAVLVWMDESYIHQGYCSRFGWYLPDDEVVSNKVKGSEKGKRLIIIHAMTRDGMLSATDIDTPSDNLSDTATSACIVTSKLSAEGFEPEDYHDTLNNEKFLAWLRNRLIPSFKKKYPSKKMILVLDNAKYHHARGPDWLVPSKMKKPECGTYLRRWGFKNLTEFKKQKDGSKLKRVFPASKFTANVSDKGPTAKFLRQEVSKYIKSHPGINTTVVHQLMSDQKYELLYTPPYESWLQPIELVWARVKHQVARKAHSGKKWQETQEDTIEALKLIDGDLCKKLVGHTEKLMKDWLAQPCAGSLRKYASLDALTKLTKAQRAKCTDLDLPEVDLIVGDVDENEEDEEMDED